MDVGQSPPHSAYVVGTWRCGNESNTVPLFSSADAASLYMMGSGDAQLYEVKAFDEDFHSWFVGQTVQRGGFLYPSW